MGWANAVPRNVSKLNYFKVKGNSVYTDMACIQHTCYVLKLGNGNLVYYLLCATETRGLLIDHGKCLVMSLGTEIRLSPTKQELSHCVISSKHNPESHLPASLFIQAPSSIPRLL